MVMTLTCDKQQLQDALGLAIRAVSPRTTMPILECVLLNAEQGVGLTLSASNLEINIDTAPIPAETNMSGSIALDAKLFSEIIRKMPGEVVSITVDEKSDVQVKSGRSRLMIHGQPSDEFPVMSEKELIPVNQGYVLKAQTLKDMIRQTIFSVSTDQSKLVLTGELIEVKDNTMRMVALDMYRISYKCTPLPGDCTDSKAIVPAKALNELSRMLSSDENEEVNVQLTDKRIIFKASNFTLTSNLLEGEFVRYDKIFNEDFISIVEINRADLLNAFERAILVATENKTRAVKLEISDDDLIISCSSERGETEDGVPCKTDGKPLTISFNPRYFIEALRAVEDEIIVLKFNTQLSPCTIRSIEDEADYKYLIVPVRTES